MRDGSCGMGSYSPSRKGGPDPPLSLCKLFNLRSLAVVERQTFIVVDRASIHTSNAILEQFEEWKERDLTIFELPTYSPELNLIEILWRSIKYEWLEIDAYSSWESLVSSVEIIFKEFGDNYVINFP